MSESSILSPLFFHSLNSSIVDNLHNCSWARPPDDLGKDKRSLRGCMKAEIIDT